MELLNPNFIQEVAPEFLVPLADVACSLGGTVVLCCRVSGRPPPSVALRGPDQTLLSSSSRVAIDIRDSGDVLLRVCNLMPEDTGIYTCVASNALGSASSSASVRVQGLPPPPGRPIAQEAGPRAVLLRWPPPPNRRQPLQRGVQAGGLSTVAAGGGSREELVQIEGLVPGGHYQFRVRASNPWGVGPPSEPSNMVTVSDSASDGAGVQWKENFDSVYTEICEIGRGRFSAVKKCLNKSTKKEVAVKVVSKKLLSKQQVAKEAELLRLAQNRHLVALLDAYESRTALLLVLELLEDGRLLDYLVASDQLLEETVAFYIQQTLQALQALHTCRVLHLDLKVYNTHLLYIHTYIHIYTHLQGPAPGPEAGEHHGGPAGLAPVGEAAGPGRRRPAAPPPPRRHVQLLPGGRSAEFSAPEQVRGAPVWPSTDVWAAGVLAYVLLSGVSPFLDESPEETRLNVLRRDFSFPPRLLRRRVAGRPPFCGKRAGDRPPTQAGGRRLPGAPLGGGGGGLRGGRGLLG
ncbi:LOW QUALITY PROTEIN: kalirin-like [Menidia menidia]